MSANTPTTRETALTSMDPAHMPPNVRAIRHIVSFLKWRFALLPRGSYRWDPEDEESPDQKGSEIFIGTETPIDTARVGSRPAITVTRSQLAFAGLGLGDLAYHDLRNASKAYQDLIPTTLVINVLARLDFVAERLAFFVQEQLFTLREEIVKTEPCILYTGAKGAMSPPQPAGSLVDNVKQDWRAVVITMPLFLQHTTSKMPLNQQMINTMRPRKATP